MPELKNSTLTVTLEEGFPRILKIIHEPSGDSFTPNLDSDPPFIRVKTWPGIQAKNMIFKIKELYDFDW